MTLFTPAISMTQTNKQTNSFIVTVVTAKYFLVFRISFPTLVVSFALLSYSICGFRRGYICLRTIYKQINLLSFVLVCIVERVQETFSVLVNVSSC